MQEADLANITAYLISEKGNDAPPCDWEPTVRLWAALNAEPARPIAIGARRMHSSGERTFPVWDFNDVDVSAARDSANKVTFFVTVDGVQTLRNVWVHAADARTILPQPDVPKNVIRYRPRAADAAIQIVWPHDGKPVGDADLANVTAYLFQAGSDRAIAPDARWDPIVRLHRAVNNDSEQAGTTVIGTRRPITTEEGLELVAWDFNDIDVSLAKDPLNKLAFWVDIDGTMTYPNVWTHGTNAPTLFPQTDVLNSCH